MTLWDYGVLPEGDSHMKKLGMPIDLHRSINQGSWSNLVLMTKYLYFKLSKYFLVCTRGNNNHIYEEPITRSRQLFRIPVTAFSQNLKHGLMLTRRHVHVRPHSFILIEACSCGLELAYFAVKISKTTGLEKCRCIGLLWELQSPGMGSSIYRFSTCEYMKFHIYIWAAENDMRIWLIIAIMNTTVKLKPEKIQT